MPVSEINLHHKVGIRDLKMKEGLELHIELPGIDRGVGLQPVGIEVNLGA